MTTTDAAPQPEQQELDQLLDSLLTEFDDAKPLSKLTTDNSASERDLNKEEKPATIDDALVQDMMAGMEELMRAMETSPELRSQMESCLADFSAVDAPKSSATTTTAAATTVPTSPNDLAAELAKIIGEMSKMECGSSSSDANVAEQQTRSASPLPAQPAKTYQETVKETMERLQNSSQKVESELINEEGGPIDEQLLEQMMKQFLDLGGSDASSAGPGSGFEGMLEGMMGQLMSKDVLYEPLIDLSKKYPEWLKLNRERLSVDEYARYEQQYRYCLQIIRLFDDNDDGGGGGGEETAGAGRALQITELMQQMQDCGAPPQEILQQLAPGLELGTDGLPHLPTSAVSAGDCPVQ